MKYETIQRTFPEADIALLTFDMPGKGANVLCRSVMEELHAHLDELQSRTDLAGLVITSGKPGQFVAGADLREFAAVLGSASQEEIEAMCQKGQQLFIRFGKLPFVSVAAIDGMCLGGGAELAAWCDRRVMSQNPKTQFGFPEVKLGLCPGWGGTARAPRVAGIYNAVEMITSGESISAKEACRMGWATDMVPAEALQEAAMALVRAEQQTRSYAADRVRWSQRVDISATELAFLGAAAAGHIQQQTKGNYPAPLAALESILGGATLEIDAACQIEAQTMAQLFGSPVNAALLNVFFLTDANKKDRGVAGKDIQAAKLQTVSVLGAGIMGAGIAAANLKRGIHVTMNDVSEDAVERGRRQVLDEVSFNPVTKQKDPDRAVEYGSKLDASRIDVTLAAADLVIEAVVEKEEVKLELFQRLEPLMSTSAILASNTSTIPITRLAAGLARPDRFCGIHFFNPVRKMKLVEVIRGEKTSDQTVVTAVAHAKALGKVPVVVRDGPGFLVNRLLLPYMEEALTLFEEGNSLDSIDKAAKRFGMPMGPIQLYDMIGIDTALFAGRVLCESFADRFSGSAIVPAMVEAGRLGQKSGRGFFSYQNTKRKAQADPELAPLLQPLVAKSPVTLSTEQLIHRLFLPMLVEGSRILEAQLVRHARDIDLAMVFGTGFPPFRGGLMCWGDTLGGAHVVELLKPLEHLGSRYVPTELLRRCAKDGTKFYDAEPTT